MPNWCITDIRISSENRQGLKRLYEDICRWTAPGSRFIPDQGFGKNWLGNIVGFSGIGVPDSGKGPRCRGRLVYIDFEDGEQITVSTETAWCPALKMWDMLAEKYLGGSYSIIFTAEEPGEGLYLTNDPDYIGNFNVDGEWDYLDSLKLGCECDVSEQQLVSLLQKELKTDESDIGALLEALEESELSDRLWVHPWEKAEIEDFD